jgi:hypothetical protein
VFRRGACLAYVQWFSYQHGFAAAFRQIFFVGILFIFFTTILAFIGLFIGHEFLLLE